MSKIYIMVKLKTKATFELSLERKPKTTKGTTRITSKILRVVRETIHRTRFRKVT